MAAFPKTLDEYLALAERLNERFYGSQELDDMLPALIAVVHIFDWYLVHSLGIEGGPEARRLKIQLASDCPEYDVVRQLANGTKHARKASGEAHPSKLIAVPVEWELDDAWDHLGTNKDNVWGVFDGVKARSVYTLNRMVIAHFRKIT